jgi:hypothetical protein
MCALADPKVLQMPVDRTIERCRVRLCQREVASMELLRGADPLGDPGASFAVEREPGLTE